MQFTDPINEYEISENTGLGVSFAALLKVAGRKLRIFEWKGGIQMATEEQAFQILPDLLKEGFRLVICGTAVADKSARLKCYYAGQGNKFWHALFETGLTGELLDCEEYPRLLEWGIGLMDLAKKKSGCDSNLSSGDFDIEGTFEKIRVYRPSMLCFNGKKAAQVFLRKGKTQEVDYGLQVTCIGKTRLYVAPSTSGAGNRWWKQCYWTDLAQLCGL